MPVPKPPASLDNSCSVIHDSTLYSYSADAFLSIRLQDGASWQKLPNGVKVTGATCIGTTPPDARQAGFFVVGGRAQSDDYTGLQKFVYSTGKWVTISPTNLITKHRQWHASTYIQANDAILVYAGSQDGVNGPSDQTFTVQASEPYTVSGYDPKAPRAVSPILLNWSAADAALLGGGTDAQNAVIYLFNPTAQWRDSGASLAQPLQKDSSLLRAALVEGADGSKSLYTFDLSQSPNQVKRMVLQDAKGLPIRNSAPVDDDGSHRASSKKVRDLRMDKWPEYNATLAPTATRHDFAMAQGPNGMVVFSGGNNDHPLAIFNTNDNGWVDPAAVFSAKEQTALVVSSTSTVSLASSTSTSLSDSSGTVQSVSPSATASDPSAPIGPQESSGSSGPSSDTILGVTLGSILGLLVLLGLILFLIKRQRKRRTHTESGHKSKGVEKEETGFNTRGLKPTSPGQHGRHFPQASQESYSSMAILMGRVGKDAAAITRKTSNETSNSSVSSLHKQFKSTISKPIPQATSQPTLVGQDDRGVAFAPTVAKPRLRNGLAEARDGVRRSSGWNRYWSGSSALQALGFGSTRRDSGSSGQSSRYSEATSSSIIPKNNNDTRSTQDSATVPHIHFEGRPEVNNVNSGSPVVSHYPPDVHAHGYAGKIERHLSESTSVYTSGIPESINDVWDFAEAEGADGVLSNARASGRQRAGPSMSGTAMAPPPPSGVSRQPQLTTAAKSSDMSWLNLGEHSRHG